MDKGIKPALLFGCLFVMSIFQSTVQADESGSKGFGAKMKSLAAGCSLTVPVKGRTDSGKQTFTGQATGYVDGSGELAVVSNDGVKCSGVFAYLTLQRGEGSFTCDDGRSGPFQFDSNGLSGSGVGQIGDEPMTFTFGD